MKMEQWQRKAQWGRKGGGYKRTIWKKGQRRRKDHGKYRTARRPSGGAEKDNRLRTVEK